MNYREIAAAAVSLTLLATITACGKDAEESASGDTSLSISADISESESSADTSEPDEESNDKTKDDTSGSKTTASAKDNKSDSTATTTAKGASAGASGSKNSTSSGGNKSGGSSSGGNSSGGNAAGGSSSAKTTAAASGGGSQAAVTTAVAASEEVNTYDAEITFSGAPTVKGSNASADGNIVRITAGGDYHVTGSSSDGQIYVSTEAEEKVKIVLDGVDITCLSGPAIFIDEAKKCTIELADGSANYLKDSVKDKVNDGVIFSNDTLRIKGGGYLEISAGNAHGIASDDDIIIESGEYNITSVKSGIFAHDDITINGGDLVVFGGTNGIKSKITVNINGGTMLISGGTKEEKSSIYAGTAFNYTGGYVYAAGNKVTAPATSANPYVVLSFPNAAAAGSSLSFLIDGYEQATLYPHNDFRCALMMSPEIYDGCTFTAYLNGAASQDFTVSGTQNVFEVE